MNKFIAIVGMAGAGKTEAANYLKEKGLGYVRFGQAVLDGVMRRGMVVSEENERKVREELRERHGMAALAILNLPKFQKALQKNHLVGDGLCGWEEYEFLQKRFGDQLIVLAIYASPKTRYLRLFSRELSKEDQKAIYRKHTPKEARNRDVAELVNLHKGGPIAMADWTIINEKSKEDLYQEIDRFLRRFNLV